jgi:hypothetical protein
MAYYALGAACFVFGILYIIFASSNLLFQMNTYLLLVTYTLVPLIMLALVVTVSAISHPKQIFIAGGGAAARNGPNMTRNSSSEKKPYKWMLKAISVNSESVRSESKKILSPIPTTPTSTNRMLTSPPSKQGESKSKENLTTYGMIQHNSQNSKSTTSKQSNTSEINSKQNSRINIQKAQDVDVIASFDDLEYV